MAVADPKSPAALPIKPTTQAKRALEAADEWWVAPLKWAALGVFVAIPFFAFFVQS